MVEECYMLKNMAKEVIGLSRVTPYLITSLETALLTKQCNVKMEEPVLSMGNNSPLDVSESTYEGCITY